MPPDDSADVSITAERPVENSATAAEVPEPSAALEAAENGAPVHTGRFEPGDGVGLPGSRTAS